MFIKKFYFIYLPNCTGSWTLKWTQILQYNRNNRLTGKVHHTPLDNVGRWSSPSPRPWACMCRTNNIYVMHGHYPARLWLPSQPQGITANWLSPIILPGTRRTHICTNNLHSTVQQWGYEPATCRLQLHHPNHSATELKVEYHEAGSPDSLSDLCGWALMKFGSPWVAQRVWARPTWLNIVSLKSSLPRRSTQKTGRSRDAQCTASLRG